VRAVGAMVFHLVKVTVKTGVKVAASGENAANRRN
jgi:hypothetical protein